VTREPLNRLAVFDLHKPMRLHMRIQNCTLAAVAALALALGSSGASAHAELKQAAPSAGGSVATAPTEVTLNFSERLESAFSTVVVRDAVGKRVDNADGHIDKTDRTILRASLKPLMPGVYIVEWRALTADTHRTEGAFIFRIGE
jgi:copper resistance protein C